MSGYERKSSESLRRIHANPSLSLMRNTIRAARRHGGTDFVAALKVGTSSFTPGLLDHDVEQASPSSRM